MKVIKKNGKEETFNTEKLKRSIMKAAKNSEIVPAERKELTEIAAKPIIALSKTQDTIESKEIKKIIYEKFGKPQKSLTASWKAFEKKT